MRGYASVDGGHDSGRKFGSYQTDRVQTHSHADLGHSHSGSSNANDNHYHGASTGAAGEHKHGAYTDTSSVAHYFLPLGHFHGPFVGGPERSVLCEEVVEDESKKYFGSHSHSVTVESSGSHTHSVDISSAGSNGM